MTAVEFIVKEISEILGPLKTEGMTDLLLLDAYKQAKEMDKEQKKFIFECGRNFQLTGEGTFEEVFNETFKSEQTEDTLKLVLNDIENTPEDVFNKQWESVKKKLKKPLKDSNPITKYLKSE